MINLKKVTIKESKFIFNIYINLLKKGATISKKKINFNNHNEWLINFLKLKNIFYVIKKKNVKIGYFRLEKKSQNYEISIALNPKYQNKGIGQKVFETVTKKHKISSIISKINKKNYQSQKFFKSLKFKKYYETKKYIVLINKLKF